MSKHLEQIDRRAFLRGLTLTSAGLLVPKAVQVFVPNEQLAFASSDFAFSTIHDEVIAYCADAQHSLAWYLARMPEFLQIGPNSFQFIGTSRTQTAHPNLSNVPKP